MKGCSVKATITPLILSSVLFFATPIFAVKANSSELKEPHKSIALNKESKTDNQKKVNSSAGCMACHQNDN